MMKEMNSMVHQAGLPGQKPCFVFEMLSKRVMFEVS